MIFSILPSTSFAGIKNGLVFSYNNGFQTQILLDFSSKYQLKPGVGFIYNQSNLAWRIVVDNDFKIGDFNKVSSFLGIGLGYNYSRTIPGYLGMYSNINDTVHTIGFNVEPNYSLQYHVSDQLSFYGSVRIMCNYNQLDNLLIYVGKTAIGIIINK